MRAGKRYALSSLYPRYGIDPKIQTPNWSAIFGGRDRMFVEIGAGSGEAVVHMAQLHNNCVFVVFEIYPPGIAQLLRSIEQNQIKNIKVVAADARPLLARWFAPSQLAGINLFFPDPWPKYRHHKRRICNRQFIDQAHVLLGSAGVLHFVTDCQDYHLAVSRLLTQDTNWELCVDHDVSSFRPPTRYERKAIAQSRKIWDIKAQPI